MRSSPVLVAGVLNHGCIQRQFVDGYGQQVVLGWIEPPCTHGTNEGRTEGVQETVGIYCQIRIGCLYLIGIESTLRSSSYSRLG